KTGFELLPSLGSNSYSYFSLNFDLRNYHHFGKGYGLALRLTAGASGGKNPKLYYLGGAESWLNWELGSSEIYTIRSMYFSEIITPLRGYALFELVGTKYYLANIELRYPFINELRLGFPLPITIRGLRGGIFADIGGAFDKPTLFRGVKNGGLNHIKLGVGCGIRTGISFLLFSWDIGWATDLVHISPHPTHYLTLSTEF
ncbi:MAG: BamA/TamA family outer membrane protein, partial [bacterium]